MWDIKIHWLINSPFFYSMFYLNYVGYKRGVDIARDVEKIVITKQLVGTIDPVTKKYKTEWVCPEISETAKSKLTKLGVKITYE